MHFVPSAYRLPHARLTFICGRAGNACTNLLGFFVRYVRTRDIAEIAGSGKPPTFALPFVALSHHALLLATNSCTREEISKRGERSL